MRSPRRFVSTAIVTLGLAATPLLPGVVPVHAANAVQTENQNAGTDAWQIPEPTACDGGLAIAACQASPPNTLLAERREIEGYATATSVPVGGQISFKVSTRSTISYYIQVFRLGWYGGLGGRLMTPPGASSPTVGPLAGAQQATPAVGPAPDYLIEATWPTSYTLNVPTTWASGYYVVKLIRADGYERYVPFTVRDDASTAAILMQASVTTWEAYNWWGGKNLYGTFNVNVTSPNYGLDIPGPAAGVVSFDRPYGNSDYTGWELEMMRYLERNGRDVTYATDIDLHTNPNLLLAPRHAAFLSVGHDEYWSNEMRTNVIHARDQGVHLGFFGANAAYFRIRFAADAAGTGNRRIICYKNPATDPLTIRWRDQGLPENAFIGTMSEGAADSNNYVVSDASSWIFNGTGLTNGSVITGLVGYEYDRTWANGASPAGLHVVAHSPTRDGSYSESSVYTATSGAIVFSAGTIQWASGLDDFRDPWANAGIGVVVSPPLQKATANILDRLSVPQAPPPMPTVTGISPSSGPASGGTVVTISGTNFSPGGTTVTFGATVATSVSCSSSTTCSATSPAGAGPVDVTVTVGPSTSATGPADQFTYPPPAAPTVTGISPTSGPAAGGTLVTINGTGFSTAAGATTVGFGPVAGTAVSCTSATSCSARSPAAGSGPVDVTVTVGGQTSATSAADQFTYTQSTGVIFSDGFESGTLAAWDGTLGSGSASVLAAAARTGGFGARLGNTTAGQYAVLLKRLPSSLDDSYTRFNVRFTGTGTATVAYGRDDSNSSTRWILYYNAANQSFSYYIFNGSGASTGITTANGVAPAGTWVTVELRYTGAATGGGQIWVNGISQPSWSASGNFATSAPYQRLQLWSDVVGSADVDDVTVSTNQTALAQPAVSAISPTSGAAAGGTVVSISGTNFSTSPGATTVNFGAAAATAVSCASATACTATSPAGVGIVDVTVTVGGQTSSPGAADQFTYPPPPPPVVSAISPTSGPAAGGTVVTITGSNFSTATGATTVSFGGVPATAVSCADGTTCSATNPAGSGVVDVTVSVGGQTSATGAADQFTYTAGLVFSDGFGSGTLAAWDGTLGSGSTSVTSAAARNGSFGVRLADSAGGQYAVLAKRLPSSLTDSYTRFSVRFTGTTAATTVAYGRDDSNSVTRWILYYDPASQSFSYYLFNGSGASTGVTTANGVAPLGTWTTVELRYNGTASGGGQIWINDVTQPGWAVSGNFANSAPYQRLQLWNDAVGANDFDDVTVSTSQTALAAPAVSSISPTNGAAAGGTLVTINGSNFATASGATTVSFGGPAATGVSCATSTTCTATSPAGAGVVDVRVTVGTQTSSPGAGDQFAYPPAPAPVVTGISPTSGPALGGTAVTITGSNFSTAAGATTVAFGAAASTAVTCASTTACTATTPAGSGTMDTVVTVGGQPSATGAADQYTFLPGVIFSDGFESGTLSAWDGAQGPGSTTVLAAAARTGTFGARLADTAAGQYALLTKRLPSSATDSYTRFNARFTGLTAPTTVAYGRDDSNNANRWILYYDPAGQAFEYYLFNGTGASTGIRTTSGVAPLASWVTVELRYTGTAGGGGQIWVNGVSQPSWSVSGDFSNTAPYQRLQLWTDAVGSTDFDDVTVSTTQTALAVPSVSSVSPASGPAAGGTAVTITGSNFSTTAGATTVAFGGSAASGVSCGSTTSCLATSPAGAGTVDVLVTVGGQTSQATTADRFSYPPAPAPAITGINPTSGPGGGGTVVTITGSNFSTAAGATTVMFGGASATGVSCSSASTCTATSPAGSGLVDVMVTVGGQSSPSSSADQFTYIAGVMFSDGFESGTLSAWDGAQGPGSTSVMAAAARTGGFGVRLADSASGQYALLTKRLPTSLTDSYTRFSARFTASAGSVTVAYGRDDSNNTTRWILYYDPAAQAFEYYLFNGSGGSSGITTASGVAPPGTWVTVELRYNGTATGGGQIWVNGVSQPSWSVSGNFSNAAPYQRLQLWNDATGNTDFDDVAVSTSQTAVPAPTVTAISPTGGPANGGTVVSISGANFSTAAGATTVAFGGAAGTGVSCSSTTACTATSPPGAGTADVQVTVGGVTSTASAADRFAYPPPPAPVVTGIAPTSGPAVGGTVVAITGTNFATVAGATTVSFGGVAGTAVSCVSTTTCSATSPSGTSVVDVVVTVGGQASTAGGADQFTYIPGVVFSDGFESGTTAAWDGTQGPGSITVLAAAARTGSFGARLADTAAGQYALLSKRLPSSLNDSYTRFAVRFTGTAAATTVAYGRDDSNSTNRWILYYDPAGQAFEYYVFNGSGASTGIRTANGVAPLGTWVTVELRYSGTAGGGGQIWVNDVTQPGWSVSGNFANSAPYQRLQLWNDAVGTTDFDDVTVSTSQTGAPPPQAPTVSAIAPASGSTGGGTAVTITGTNFATAVGATTVAFGGAAGTSVSCASATTCSATSPGGSGTVDVRVTVSGQTSAANAADQFGYVAPPPPPAPTVSGISPTAGPAAGGTVVTITGTNFDTAAGTTTVAFGTAAGTAVTCASTTSCSATSPAGNGVVDVRVTVAGQGSATSAADQFSYTPAPPPPAPTVSGISPATGPGAGGTLVTITGTNFSTAAGAASVAFGPAAGTAVTCSSVTSCVATSPAGTGAVDITVSVAGQASATSTADRFSYVAGQVFSDGFESGTLSAWDGAQGPGSTSVLAAAAHAGAFGLRLANTTGQYALLAKHLPTSVTDSYTRFAVRFSGTITTTTVAYGRDESNNTVLWTLYYNPTTQAFSYYLFNSAGVSTGITTANGVAPLDTWVTVELRYNGTATGGGQIWVNDLSQTAWSVTGDFSSSTPYRRLQLWNDVVGTTDLDDVTVSTLRTAP